MQILYLPLNYVQLSKDRNNTFYDGYMQNKSIYGSIKPIVCFARVYNRTKVKTLHSNYLYFMRKYWTKSIY